MTHESRPPVELLAPAGSPEKLEIAIHYGADAVYLAGKAFSLRNFSGNFSMAELKHGIADAHQKGVKVYVATNVFSRNHEQSAIAAYLAAVGRMEPDAFIISDPGVLRIAQQHAPHIPIHLSTQANTTNLNSALFWRDSGVKRINTARELSLEEIRGISDACDIEIEAFVHGAMCMSYSGRCLLSAFMTHRDSNRGMCAHPCRWRYAVVEETRPGKYFPVFEDDRGAYIFNAADLCMIDHLPAMIRAGISSLKIEGRMKGINYLAATVKVYREAIDDYTNHSATFGVKDAWRQELSHISHRSYCTGFYFGDPDQILPNYDNASPATLQTFLGKVVQNLGHKTLLIDTRNKFFDGEWVEILPARGPARKDQITSIRDETGKALSFVQPNRQVLVTLGRDYAPNDLIRRPC
ncbi:MAG: U32 family peptidase [Desulfobacterales bacterium]|nr:U32 family peptidase [Desulfobacterales bacterium]